MATDGKDGSLASAMRALWESGEGADVTLAVGGAQLPAHSLVLAARSSVFAAMLRNDTREAVTRHIEIADVKEDVLRQLLSFVYTDAAPQLASTAAELLAAADKYDLPLLKKMCEEKMAQELSVENAAATAALAVLHSCPGLEAAAVGFVGRHPQAMATGGWLDLLRGSPEAAAHICSRVVEATNKNPQKNRPSPVEQTQALAWKLTEAAKAGEEAEVRRLLAAGAPVDARDGSGFTALHLTVMKAGIGVSRGSLHPAVLTINCLLNAGADVDARDSSWQTPLHAAANRGNVRILWALVTASADLDARDRWGKTPLHWAVAANKEAVVRALLQAGADKYQEDYKGIRPDFAAKESIRILLNKY